MTCADRACMRQDIQSMDSTVTRIVSCATAAVLLLLSSGCGDREINESLPSILKIGILPDESRVKLDERYEPLRQYLSESLGIPCQLVFADTYDAMVESFGVGAVHLAYFGGVTYVQARTAYDAVPLVMRDVDTRFTTCFVAKADNACSTLASYEGSVIAFGSRLSTSGHLMPRHFLGDLTSPRRSFSAKSVTQARTIRPSSGCETARRQSGPSTPRYSRGCWPMAGYERASSRSSGRRLPIQAVSGRCNPAWARNVGRDCLTPFSRSPPPSTTTMRS